MLLRELTPETMPRRLIALAADVVLLACPGDAGPMDGVAPPYGSVTLEGPAGRCAVVAMRKAAGLVVAAEEAGLGELAAELDPVSARRLLGFLLGFCRTAFGLSADAGFAGACLHLARLCARDEGAAEPVATAGPDWTLLSGIRAPAGASLHVLGAGRAVSSPAAPVAEGLQLVTAVRPGDRVLALCETPLMWTVGAAARRDVARDAPLRAACLRALAPSGALLREVQALAPATARRHDARDSPLGAALEAAIPDGEGGLFLRGWLRDPLQLVARAEIRTPLASAVIGPGRLHRVRRPDLAERYGRAAFRDDAARPGFVAHVPDPSGGLCAQPTLALRLGSGAVIEVTAPLRHLPAAQARDAVLGCVAMDEATPALLDGCLGPAAAALHRAASAGVAVPEVVRIGARAVRPAVSVIIPLYRNLGFMRFQVAAFAADAECRRAELIYVRDSPEQRAEAESLLRGLHAMHGLSFTLLVMDRNRGYAAANNAAAAHAVAPLLLLLNSDVVPAAPGWLGALRAAVAPAGVGAAGPRLLFDDGSIQHAGLYFQRGDDGTWYNAHYHKGMPRHWPAALRRRRVPAVTGAALLVRAALFHQVGGVCADYIIGDYEDSDFCLRLQQAGVAIPYAPGAELFHFERRSIQLHAGYTRTLAAAYNRRLHHRRWDADIAALMARPGHAATRGGMREAA